MLPSGNRFLYPVHGEEGGVLPAQLHHVITSAAKTTVVCDLLSPDGAKESEGASGRCCVPSKTMETSSACKGLYGTKKTSCSENTP